jgi:hypothetical protein
MKIPKGKWKTIIENCNENDLLCKLTVSKTPTPNKGDLVIEGTAKYVNGIFTMTETKRYISI